MVSLYIMYCKRPWYVAIDFKGVSVGFISVLGTLRNLVNVYNLCYENKNQREAKAGKNLG